MSNHEVEYSSEEDEEYTPPTKNRNSMPLKSLKFSTKMTPDTNPFGTASQSSPKKASKKTAKSKTSNTTK